MKYKVIEPLDEDIPIVRPGKVRALLSLILENNLLSLDQFLDTYSIDSTFLESLLGIDEDVLKEYKGISKLDYFDRRVITML